MSWDKDEALGRMCEKLSIDISCCYDFEDQLNTIANHYHSLETQLKEAREVVEFYGDIEKWDNRRHDICDIITCKDINRCDDNTVYGDSVYGGKKARQFLKDNPIGCEAKNEQ